MKPLIKWPGGKSKELKHINRMIPQDYDRYFEPFFGGGALFFNLEPKKAFINDIAPELILFYKHLKNGKRIEFQKELSLYVKYWKRIDIYVKKFGNLILNVFNAYRKNSIEEYQFIEKINTLFEERIVPFNGLFSEDFAISKEDLLISMEKNLISKLNRIKKKIDIKNNFSGEEVIKNIETALRSGFYMHFREIMNKNKKGLLNISKARSIANYYFVREFCYGSMFRFNQSGEFNIPYGGNAYNKKDFQKKVAHVFSKGVKQLLKRTQITNMDFEQFFIKYKPTKKDFIFLDPPYDTKFSDYEKNPFTKKDQKRLAELLYNTKASFILIIKETPFIKGLYKNKQDIKIKSFDKTYLYNVKGRNDRQVKHLIIHNIKDSQQNLNFC